MKTNNWLGLILLAFGFFVFVAAVNAQSVAPSVPLPLASGKSAKLRLASKEEIAEKKGATRSSSKARNNDPAGPPVFAIQVYGDTWNTGVTANAINVDVIPANTFFGADGDHYLWYTEEEIPAGYVWYNLDNHRRLSYTGSGRVMDYSMFTITQVGDNEYSYREYNAKKNFGVGGTPVPQVVEDGIAVNTNRGPVFHLFGNFLGGVGVLLEIPDFYTMSIPKEAITRRGRGIVIDTSRIPDFFVPAGDYRVTVVDSTGYSDSGFQVRLLQQSDKNSLLRLKALQDLYAQ